MTEKAVYSGECSQCGCFYTDSEPPDPPGCLICLTCGDRIRRSAGTDPKDAPRLRHRLLMASRQLDRKMAGIR